MVNHVHEIVYSNFTGLCYIVYAWYVVKSTKFLAGIWLTSLAWLRII